MGFYLARRTAVAVATLLAATFLTFVLLRLVPGEPARIILTRVFVKDVTVGVSKAEIESVTEQYQLNDPLVVQYARWARRAMKGDLGVSVSSGRAVSTELGWRLSRTGILAILATGLSLILTFGAVLLVRRSRRRWPRTLIHGLSITSIGMPAYYLGIILIIIFSLKLNLLPVSGVASWQNWVLPVSVLAFGQLGFNISLLNGSLDEALDAPYSVTAQAKGLTASEVLHHHALPNALVPLVPFLSLEFAHLMGGVIVIEQLFGIPGIGAYLLEALNNHDAPAFLGCVAVIGLAVSGAALLADVIVSIIDPRIRFSGRQ